MAHKASPMVFLHYLNSVFDSLEEAVLLIGVEPNGTFRLLMANAAFTRNTGHSGDHEGKAIDTIVSPEAYTALKKRYNKVIASRRSMEYTEWYNVPMGRQAYEVKLIPVLNAVGEVAQIAAITRNVTELYNTRMELQELRRQLYNSQKGKAKPAAKSRA